MKLAAISPNDVVTAAVIMAMMLEVPFLNNLEFMRTTSEAVPYKPTDVADMTGEFRAKGSDWAGATPISHTPTSAALGIFGEPVTIDKFEKQTHMDIPALKTAKMRSVGKALAKDLVKYVFTGSGASNQWKGITPIVETSGLGIEVALATNGLDLNTTSNWQTFFMTLNEYIAAYNPSVIAMNPTFWTWFTWVAEERHALTWAKNEYGQMIHYYNGIPIIPIRGSAIPSTETQGTSSDCTSLYLLKFGELSDITIYTTMGIDVTDFVKVGSSPLEEGAIDIAMTPVLYNNDALIRIKGARFV